MSFVDRNVLQSELEADLSQFLEARSAMGPIPPWDLMKVSEQVRNINRKANDTGVSAELLTSAVAKHHVIQSELACLELDDNPLIERVRHLIHTWLPPLEMVEDDMWSRCRFGPGTVYHAKEPHQRSIHHKIGGLQTVTPKAYFLAKDVIARYFPRFGECISGISIVRGNRLAGVPKDTGRCRLIAVEPSLNVFLQLGVGEFLKNLLLRFGISDLSHGQSTHRDLVKDYEDWGTIDLSDASDRISYSLCKKVLPGDWFELLDSLRSHYFYHEGEWSQYSSFSSQGNAFTFPLETMIFKAVAVAASGRRVYVYGDDIIAPLESCPSIASALESFGFVVNTQKSFWGQHDGILSDFRESCGEDTCRGKSVRSVYYKDSATSDSDVAGLCNMLFEKWGFLPRTHRYLVSCLQGPVFTGPKEYSSASDSGGWNTNSREYTSWVWWDVTDPLGLPRPEGKYSRHIQAYILRLKYWSRKTIDMHPRFLISDDVSWLSFLYSGSPSISPLDKPCVRRKTLTQFLN